MCLLSLATIVLIWQYFFFASSVTILHIKFIHLSFTKYVIGYCLEKGRHTLNQIKEGYFSSKKWEQKSYLQVDLLFHWTLLISASSFWYLPRPLWSHASPTSPSLALKGSQLKGSIKMKWKPQDEKFREVGSIPSPRTKRVTWLRSLQLPKEWRHNGGRTGCRFELLRYWTETFQIIPSMPYICKTSYSDLTDPKVLPQVLRKI